MKNTLIIVMILLSLVSFGQNTITQVEQLIKERKFDSAFKLLEEKDAENEDPSLVLKKVDIALNYFVKSISHQAFAFKDLEDGEDIYSLRASENDQSFSLYMFPINEILDSLTSIYPNQFELYKALGNFYYEVHLKYGQNWIMEQEEVLRKMYANCSKAAENDTADYLTHYCIGYYHTLRESYNKAIPSYLNSIELDSSYPTSYYNLSICYLYTDQAAIGVKYAVKSIDLYEDISYKADAARVAATMYKEVKDFDNALKYYKKSDQIEPSNYYTINQLLELQLEIGDLKESRKTANEFFNLDPKNPRICTDLLNIYTITNQEQELLDFLNLKIKEFNSEKEVLGNIYFHLGKFYSSKEDDEKAKTNLLLARKNFEAVLDKEHNVFQIIDQALKDK